MQNTFHIIQDEMNALQVQARLISKGADRKVVNEIIKKYEELVHPLIYPIIIKDENDRKIVESPQKNT